MATKRRQISNSLKPVIDFTITIERTDESPSNYHVWLSLADDDMDFEECPFAFIAGTFDSFDAAVGECLAAFPGREIRAALIARPPCMYCNGTGRVHRQIHTGPYGAKPIVCSVCSGSGHLARDLETVPR